MRVKEAVERNEGWNDMDDLELIAAVKTYKVIEKIADGCSGDEKYKLQKDGKYFLLRIGDKTMASEKKKEYDQLAIYADYDMNTQKPIVFGTTTDIFYSIVTWVEGIPIMDIIKKDMSKDYYQLGKKVGMELQKLHSLSPTNLKADRQTYLKMTVADWKNHPSLSDDEWRNIRCPAFFINGEKDTLGTCTELHEKVPASRIYEVRGGGHRPHFIGEQIEEINAKVLEFLSDIDG